MKSNHVYLGPDLSKSDNALQNKNETISKKRGKEEKQPTKVEKFFLLPPFYVILAN